MPMLWNIQIAFRQKIALLGIFGLGFFSVAGMLSHYFSCYDKTHDNC